MPDLTDPLDDAVVAEGATYEVSHCWGSHRGYGGAALGGVLGRTWWGWESGFVSDYAGTLFVRTGFERKVARRKGLEPPTF